eukprot:1212211-Rhodomonas_salina.3
MLENGTKCDLPAVRVKNKFAVKDSSEYDGCALPLLFPCFLLCSFPCSLSAPSLPSAQARTALLPATLLLSALYLLANQASRWREEAVACGSVVGAASEGVPRCARVSHAAQVPRPDAERAAHGGAGLAHRGRAAVPRPAHARAQSPHAPPLQGHARRPPPLSI